MGCGRRQDADRRAISVADRSKLREFFAPAFLSKSEARRKIGHNAICPDSTAEKLLQFRTVTLGLYRLMRS
jgi:hypothetical protein